jgi:N-acyl-phosphatidylethanolamine-hydrolysing phospholipase D
MNELRPPDGPSHHAPNGRFRNPWAGSVEHGFGSALQWTVDRARKGRLGFRARGEPPRNVEPSAIPSRAPVSECRVTWIGHSTFLLQIGGINVLTDPMFSERASPVQFAGPRRLVPPGLTLDALPALDLVLQSHNHYDHFDDASIRALARHSPAAMWCAPLGVGARLRERGVTTVTECDWHDDARCPGAEGAVARANVTCVPARHFSGRSLMDRNSTLWCGWTLAAGSHRIYFAGDSAYHPDFAAIGERSGPFDAVLMPIGAYDPRWFMSSVHMNPEEAVQAFAEVRSAHPLHPSVMAAMHWGTFVLTDEPVDEPPSRTRTAWSDHGLPADALWILAPGETRVLGG